MSYETIETEQVPIKAWTCGVPIEEQAKEQLRNVAALPFIYKHLAVMPDVHWGKGATVGSVIATKGAIVPAAVGVDIGCGMVAAMTDLAAADVPDNLGGVRTQSRRPCRTAAPIAAAGTTAARGARRSRFWRGRR